MRKFAFVLYRLEMAIYFERLVRAYAGTGTTPDTELLRACPTYSTVIDPFIVRIQQPAVVQGLRWRRHVGEGPAL